jgi:hypothetical protein
LLDILIHNGRRAHVQLKRLGVGLRADSSLGQKVLHPGFALEWSRVGNSELLGHKVYASVGPPLKLGSVDLMLPDPHGVIGVPHLLFTPHILQHFHLSLLLSWALGDGSLLWRLGHILCQIWLIR